jgi:3-dehydroquinate synthase
MADSAAFEPLAIASHAGTYRVTFESGEPFSSLDGTVDGGTLVIIDARVAELYRRHFESFARPRAVVAIEATEPAKSLERCPAYIEQLIAAGLKRNHRLLAVGGGVIQDITCFLAAVVLRGVAWDFVPTTLLAQADSCIGSKSSINVGAIKNIVGTFTPPRAVVINTRFLSTLPEVEVRSGIGEMLKVHAIEGPGAFARIADDYDRLAADDAVMGRYIEASLRIKQRIIEIDEFDRGPRRVMNYGHSFGHAIESATGFGVPHGIAVTIGMDMANWVAAGLGVAPSTFDRMHPTLLRNAAGFERTRIPLDGLIAALARDKKNTDAALTLVLPDAGGRIGLRSCDNDTRFRELCASYLDKARVA